MQNWSWLPQMESLLITNENWLWSSVFALNRNLNIYYWWRRLTVALSGETKQAISVHRVLPPNTLLSLLWTCFGKFDLIWKCSSVRIIVVKGAFSLMISFPHGKDLPALFFLFSLNVSPILTQDCSATSGSSVFNNSIINIETFPPFARDPELSYRINDDDVSLLTIPQLEAFLFCQVVSFFFFTFWLCPSQRKVTNLYFTRTGHFPYPTT